MIDRRPRRGVHLSDHRVHTHGLMLRPSALRAVARRSGILRSVASPRSMSSLVPDTLKDMASDTGDSEGVEMSLQKLRKQGQARLTREEKKRRRRALEAIGVPDFAPFLEARGVQPTGVPLTRGATTLLQVNAVPARPLLLRASGAVLLRG